MKSDIEKRVIDSLEEFADKLERNEPIDVTRMRRCPRCNGNGRIEMLEHCPRCDGVGYLRTKHKMTGRTIRENNLDRQHSLAVGTLVEVKYDDWYGDGACSKVHARLWIVECGRDSDGAPMYYLSRWKDPELARLAMDRFGGFSEDSLTPIEITQDILDGHGALEWEQEHA